MMVSIKPSRPPFPTKCPTFPDHRTFSYSKHRFNVTEILFSRMYGKYYIPAGKKCSWQTVPGREGWGRHPKIINWKLLRPFYGPWLRQSPEPESEPDSWQYRVITRPRGRLSNTLQLHIFGFPFLHWRYSCSMLAAELTWELWST